jgi:hypothetical protein
MPTKATEFEFLSDAAIDAAIKSIKTRGSTLDRDIHIAATSIVYGTCTSWTWNTTRLSSLFAALPKSAKRTAFTDWVEFVTNGMVTIDVKSGTVGLAKIKDREAWLSGLDREEFADTLRELPFWEFKRVQLPTAPTIDTMVEYTKKVGKNKQADEATKSVAESLATLLERVKKTCTASNGELDGKRIEDVVAKLLQLIPEPK